MRDAYVFCSQLPEPQGRPEDSLARQHHLPNPVPWIPQGQRQEPVDLIRYHGQCHTNRARKSIPVIHGAPAAHLLDSGFHIPPKLCVVSWTNRDLARRQCPKTCRGGSANPGSPAVGVTGLALAMSSTAPKVNTAELVFPAAAAGDGSNGAAPPWHSAGGECGAGRGMACGAAGLLRTPAKDTGDSGANAGDSGGEGRNHGGNATGSMERRRNHGG